MEAEQGRAGAGPGGSGDRGWGIGSGMYHSVLSPGQAGEPVFRGQCGALGGLCCVSATGAVTPPAPADAAAESMPSLKVASGQTAPKA